MFQVNSSLWRSSKAEKELSKVKIQDQESSVSSMMGGLGG